MRAQWRLTQLPSRAPGGRRCCHGSQPFQPQPGSSPDRALGRAARDRSVEPRDTQVLSGRIHLLVPRPVDRAWSARDRGDTRSVSRPARAVARSTALAGRRRSSALVQADAVPARRRGLSGGGPRLSPRPSARFAVVAGIRLRTAHARLSGARLLRRISRQMRWHFHSPWPRSQPVCRRSAAQVAPPGVVHPLCHSRLLRPRAIPCRAGSLRRRRDRSRRRSTLDGCAAPTSRWTAGRNPGSGRSSLAGPDRALGYYDSILELSISSARDGAVGGYRRCAARVCGRLVVVPLAVVGLVGGCPPSVNSSAEQAFAVFAISFVGFLLARGDALRGRTARRPLPGALSDQPAAARPHPRSSSALAALARRRALVGVAIIGDRDAHAGDAAAALRLHGPDRQAGLAVSAGGVAVEERLGTGIGWARCLARSPARSRWRRRSSPLSRGAPSLSRLSLGFLTLTISSHRGRRVRPRADAKARPGDVRWRVMRAGSTDMTSITCGSAARPPAACDPRCRSDSSGTAASRS